MTDKTIAEAIAILNGREVGKPDVAVQMLQLAIQQEALEVLRRELSEEGIALVYAMAQNRETVKAAVAEALRREQEAERMDCPPAIMLEDYDRRLHLQVGMSQEKYSAPLPDEYRQTATQQDGAIDGDLQCDMCRTHVLSTNAVAYEDGYFCPACASKALRTDSIGIHRLQGIIASLRARLADAGLSAQDATQEN